MVSTSENIPIDIIIPVYEEGESIIGTLTALVTYVKAPFRVLICYDHDEDNTLSVVRESTEFAFPIKFVKNQGSKAHGAILTGVMESQAPAVITYMADDDYNAGIIDLMIAEFQAGADIVVPSRFMRGGSMVGCRWQKAFLVRFVAFIMFYFLRLPVHDPTNGFRLFSRKVITQIKIESKLGFAYSIEWLVKCHRMGWKIVEIPAQWFERKQGKSKFRIMDWATEYLRWLFYQTLTLFTRRTK